MVERKGKRKRSGDSPVEPALADTLAGDLPCLGCGYNLRGLSIRAVCPECGTAVRAAILARVDPLAEELRPLRRPVVLAYALIVWAWAAVGAAALVWAQRLADVLGIWLITPVRLEWGVDLGLTAIAISGLGACVLVRPFTGRIGWDDGKALAGVAAYLPLLYFHALLHGEYDQMRGVPFIGPEGMDEGRALLRLAENLLIVIIILALRPNAVALAERSLVMRTGRVDTQPMTALVFSLALASGGDILRLGFGRVGGIGGDLLLTLELVIIAVGSFLFTLGLVGIGVDVVRLRPVLIRPSPGLTDIFEHGHRGEQDA